MVWCGASCLHMECGHAPCISQQEITSRCILLYVYNLYAYNNNIIIMCIGLINDIFTRNIYNDIEMKIDN